VLLPKPAPLDRFWLVDGLLAGLLAGLLVDGGVLVLVDDRPGLASVVVAAGDCGEEPNPLDRGLAAGLLAGAMGAPDGAGDGRRFWVLRKLRFCTGAGGAL